MNEKIKKQVIESVALKMAIELVCSKEKILEIKEKTRAFVFAMDETLEILGAE